MRGRAEVLRMVDRLRPSWVVSSSPRPWFTRLGPGACRCSW
jgi:hypothetical protein